MNSHQARKLARLCVEFGWCKSHNLSILEEELLMTIVGTTIQAAINEITADRAKLANQPVLPPAPFDKADADDVTQLTALQTLLSPPVNATPTIAGN
jgi:hypothetical protein